LPLSAIHVRLHHAADRAPTGPAAAQWAINTRHQAKNASDACCARGQASLCRAVAVPVPIVKHLLALPDSQETPGQTEPFQ